jgi:hypothetical protein
MFENIVDHSIIYTPKNGFISISLLKNSIFSIVDSSPDIDECEHEEVLSVLLEQTNGARRKWAGPIYCQIDS